MLTLYRVKEQIIVTFITHSISYPKCKPQRTQVHLVLLYRVLGNYRIKLQLIVGYIKQAKCSNSVGMVLS